MYRCNYFTLRELVPPEVYYEYEKRGRLWVLWRRFDDRFLMTLDQLREDFGVAYLNNWHRGGKLKYSGVRPETIPQGENWAEDTSHRDWNTGDIKFYAFKGLKYKDRCKEYDRVRETILEGNYKHITVIESGKYAPNWLHFSTGNFRNGNGSIKVIAG